MPLMRRNRILLVAILAMSVLAAGCGGGGGDGGDAAPTGAATDPIPEGDPEAGRDAFILGTDPRCGDCHTIAEAGTTGTIGPNLDELQPTFEQVLAAIDEGPGEMPSFADMSPVVKDNIAAYIATYAGTQG